MIKTLTYRTLNICSSKILLNQRCKLIKEILIKNGYPINLIKRKIKNTIDQYQKKNSTDQNKIKTKSLIPFTYHGIETTVMSNKIKKIIEGLFPTTEMTFGFKKGLTLSKLCTKSFKGTDPMSIGIIKGVPERMATFCFKIISLSFCASDLNFFLKESSFNSLQKYLFSLM